MELINCPFCERKFTLKGIGSHIWRTHGDGKQHNSAKNYILGTRTSWNKGLTKETDKRVNKSSETQKKRFKTGEIPKGFLGKHHKKETLKNISQKLSLNNKGGKCKWYEFTKSDGDKFSIQGKWEFLFCEILEYLDKDWIKIGINNKNYSLEWFDDENKIHHYTPDFYCPNIDRLFEIKGYFRDSDKIKMQRVIKQNNIINLEIIEKKQLIDYCIQYNVEYKSIL